MKRLCILFLSLLILLPVGAGEVVSLSGYWQCAIADSASMASDVVLPGMVPVSGKRVSFRRSVYVPSRWRDQRIFIYLERPLFATNVYVNGYKVGNDSILSVAHQFDITSALRLGERNSVVISGTSEGAFTGIMGAMELRTKPEDAYIRQVKLQPLPFHKVLRTEVQLEGTYSALSNYPMRVLMQREGVDTANVNVVDFAVDVRQMNVDVPLTGMVYLWDEFTPELYRVGISVDDDYQEMTTGLRQFTIDGQQAMLNQRPLFFRGVKERHQFEGGYPPTDEQPWREIFMRYKACGLNLVCFSDYCPTEAAFDVADRLGLMLYLSERLPMRDRIIDAYGRHPSLTRRLPSLCCISDTADLKSAIERELSTPDSPGYLLQSLPDSISADEMHQFSSALVPLAHFQQKEYTSADTLVVDVDCYNAFYGDITRARASYFVANAQQEILVGGQLFSGGIPIGKGNRLGTIVVPLDKIKESQQLTLTIVLSGNKYVNHWNFKCISAKEKEK